MKPSWYLNYFMLVLYSVKAELAYRTAADYVPLILRARDFYSSSAVIFAHPGDMYGDYGDLHLTHIVHTWSRILGHEHVVNLDVHFRKMYRVKRYFRNIVRPLIIVLIPNPLAVSEFANATQSFKMSFATWLVVFLQMPKNKKHNFCHAPEGNPFNLKFNTEMLVLCQDDNILREWYSIDTSTTEMSELATYDPLRGIVLHTNLSLYDRRNDLKGTILRGIMTENAIFFDEKNGQFTGFFGSVFNELTETLNFTIKIVNKTIEYGSFNSTTHAWSGAIAQIISGFADISVSDFSMTSDRLDVVDYLIPLLLSRNCLFIMEPEIFNVQWGAYFQIFSPAIWFSLITIITIVPVVLISTKKYGGSANNVRTISEEFLQVWGIFCQQSLTEFPKSSWLRVAYFTIFGTAVVTSAAYSASLICFLTARVPFLPFLSINEFVRDGSYGLIVTRGSADYDMFANSKDPISMATMKLMRPYDTLPINDIDAYRNICKDSKLAFYSSEELRNWVGTFSPCKLSIINAARIDSLSPILSKDSPYTTCLNHHLQKFFSNGLLDRFKVGSYAVNYDRDITFQPVEIYNVLTLLAIFGGGVFLSVIVLILETLYYYNHVPRVKPKNSFNAHEWTGFAFLE